MHKSGILLVDKPKGLSSAAVVAKIKRQFGINKIGHGGTLDPFATGLLVILVEEATKIARFLLEGEKTYLAKAVLGFETTTGDPEGEAIEESRNNSRPENSAWEKSLPQFVGTILQKPPAFSALKKDGKRLYELARAGEKVEVEARPVTIHHLELQEQGADQISFLVRCGGGTYIRSLAQDWARATGTAAHLAELRRIETLGFSLEKAHTLDDILAYSRENLPFIGLGEALSQLPRLECNREGARKVHQGNLSGLTLPASPVSGFYFLESENKPIAILSYGEGAPRWQIERVFLL